MKRPLVVLLVFLIAGILTGRFADGVVLFFVPALLLLAISFFYIRSLRWLLPLALLFLAAYFFGVAGVGASLGIKNEALENRARAGAITSFTGVVTDVSLTSTSRRQKIILKTDGDGLKIQGVLPAGGELVRLGQRLKLEGSLNLFSPRRNPGGFDEFIYMRSRKVQYKIPDAVATLQGEDITGIGPVIFGFRDKLAAVYDEALPPREAGIAKSLTLGDRSGLEDEIEDLYRLSGIYHILSISGLHISIIAAIVLWILSRFLSRRIAGAVAILLITAYCVMTGNGVATVRAVVMFSVAVIGRIISRENDLSTSTSFACICLLVYEPLYLFDIGFQYSFAAVYGLATMVKPLERIFILLAVKFPVLSGFSRSKLASEAITATLAATLATTPVLAYHFFYFLPYSPVVNLIILPSTSLIVGLAALICLVGLAFMPLAVFLSGSVYGLLKFYEMVCIFFVWLPGAILFTGQIPIEVGGLWYLCCTSLVFALSASVKKMAKLFAVFFLCVVLLAACAVYKNNILRRDTEITVLDVSGGNCIVISKGAKTYIIDCGGWYNADEKNNSGIKTIAPYLSYKGITEVDGFFSTYWDQDYLVNLRGLVSQKHVENIFAAGIIETNRITLGNVAGTPVHEIQPGDIVTDGDFSFECLTENMTMLFSSDGVNVLFIGEKDSEAERRIMSALGERAGNVDIIKFPSGKAVSEALARELSPKVMVLSNRARYMPKWIEEPNEWLAEELDIPMYDTAVNGAVVLRITRGGEGTAVVLVRPEIDGGQL